MEVFEAVMVEIAAAAPTVNGSESGATNARGAEVQDRVQSAERARQRGRHDRPTVRVPPSAVFGPSPGMANTTPFPAIKMSSTPLPSVSTAPVNERPKRTVRLRRRGRPCPAT